VTLLDIDSLSKSYKSFTLGPVDLQLQAGLVYGLVGENGAGKSTLFRSIMGTVRRDQGIIKLNEEIADSKTAQWKQSIGYVGDYTPLFENWNARKNFEAFGAFYENWSLAKAISMARAFNLNLNMAVKNFSTGQRNKLAIVLAFSHQSKLLLLDEPTSGLDPVARETFMNFLVEEIQNGDVAVLYATHHVNEIEKLADEIIFINSGKVVNQQIKEDLAQNWRTIAFRCSGIVDDIPGQVSISHSESDYEVLVDKFESALAFLKADPRYESIDCKRLSIEEITVQILKQHLRDPS
jgi:ABC-2 type transport system ATP-binding protein